MKAISLWQPWASALFALRPDGRPIKPHETRSWPLPDSAIGVEVAIHAAKRQTKDEEEFWMDVVLDTPHRRLYGQAFAAIGVSKWSDLPLGCIIGTVVFASSWRAPEDLAVELIASEWGNYSAGRYAWPTVQRTLFAKPIPCVGRQGFFNVEITP